MTTMGARRGPYPEPVGTFRDLPDERPARTTPTIPDGVEELAGSIARTVAAAVPPSFVGEDGFYRGWTPVEVAESIVGDPSGLLATLGRLADQGDAEAAREAEGLSALVAAAVPARPAPADERDGSPVAADSADRVPLARFKVPRECVYVLDEPADGRTLARVTLPMGTRVAGVPMGGWSMTCALGTSARRQMLERADYVGFQIRADRPKTLRRGRDRADVDPWSLVSAIKRQRERTDATRGEER